MKHLIALVFACLVACAATSDVRMHPPHMQGEPPLTLVRTVLVDSAFDEADQEAITGALGTWNETLAGVLRFQKGTTTLDTADFAGPDILILRVDSTCTFIPPVKEGHVLGFTDKLGGSRVWIVRDRLGAWQVQPVVLHELGHVLGARDRDAAGLMRGTFTPLEYRCVDYDTALEVGATLGVPVARLAYCTTS